MAITLVVNGIPHTVDVEPDTPLLWVLRDSLKLTGTKYGCGIAQCGACTVMMDGQAIRSCSYPIASVAGKSITTIEGLSADGTHPVQLAWIESETDRCRDQQCNDQHLPLRDLSAYPGGHPSGI